MVMLLGSWRSPSSRPVTFSLPPPIKAGPRPPNLTSISVMSTTPISSIIWRLKTLASRGVLFSGVLVPVTELVLVAS
jgi:hypothetical protein